MKIFQRIRRFFARKDLSKRSTSSKKKFKFKTEYSKSRAGLAGKLQDTFDGIIQYDSDEKCEKCMRLAKKRQKEGIKNNQFAPNKISNENHSLSLLKDQCDYEDTGCIFSIDDIVKLSCQNETYSNNSQCCLHQISADVHAVQVRNEDYANQTCLNDTPCDSELCISGQIYHEHFKHLWHKISHLNFIDDSVRPSLLNYCCPEQELSIRCDNLPLEIPGSCSSCKNTVDLQSASLDGPQSLLAISYPNSGVGISVTDSFSNDENELHSTLIDNSFSLQKDDIYEDDEGYETFEPEANTHSLKDEDVLDTLDISSRCYSLNNISLEEIITDWTASVSLQLSESREFASFANDRYIDIHDDSLTDDSKKDDNKLDPSQEDVDSKQKGNHVDNKLDPLQQDASKQKENQEKISCDGLEMNREYQQQENKTDSVEHNGLINLEASLAISNGMSNIEHFSVKYQNGLDESCKLRGEQIFSKSTEKCNQEDASKNSCMDNNVFSGTGLNKGQNKNNEENQDMERTVVKEIDVCNVSQNDLPQEIKSAVCDAECFSKPHQILISPKQRADKHVLGNDLEELSDNVCYVICEEKVQNSDLESREIRRTVDVKYTVEIEDKLGGIPLEKHASEYKTSDMEIGFLNGTHCYTDSEHSVQWKLSHIDQKLWMEIRQFDDSVKKLDKDKKKMQMQQGQRNEENFEGYQGESKRDQCVVLEINTEHQQWENILSSGENNMIIGLNPSLVISDINVSKIEDILDERQDRLDESFKQKCKKVLSKSMENKNKKQKEVLDINSSMDKDILIDIDMNKTQRNCNNINQGMEISIAAASVSKHALTQDKKTTVCDVEILFSQLLQILVGQQHGIYLHFGENYSKNLKMDICHNFCEGQVQNIYCGLSKIRKIFYQENVSLLDVKYMVEMEDKLDDIPLDKHEKQAIDYRSNGKVTGFVDRTHCNTIDSEHRVRRKLGYLDKKLLMEITVFEKSFPMKKEDRLNGNMLKGGDFSERSCLTRDEIVSTHQLSSISLLGTVQKVIYLENKHQPRIKECTDIAVSKKHNGYKILDDLGLLFTRFHRNLLLNDGFPLRKLPNVTFDQSLFIEMDLQDLLMLAVQCKMCQSASYKIKITGLDILVLNECMHTLDDRKYIWPVLGLFQQKTNLTDSELPLKSNIGRANGFLPDIMECPGFGIVEDRCLEEELKHERYVNLLEIPEVQHKCQDYIDHRSTILNVSDRVYANFDENMTSSSLHWYNHYPCVDYLLKNGIEERNWKFNRASILPQDNEPELFFKFLIDAQYCYGKNKKEMSRLSPGEKILDRIIEPNCYFENKTVNEKNNITFFSGSIVSKYHEYVHTLVKIINVFEGKTDISLLTGIGMSDAPFAVVKSTEFETSNQSLVSNKHLNGDYAPPGLLVYLKSSEKQMDSFPEFHFFRNPSKYFKMKYLVSSVERYNTSCFIDTKSLTTINGVSVKTTIAEILMLGGESNCRMEEENLCVPVFKMVEIRDCDDFVFKGLVKKMFKPWIQLSRGIQKEITDCHSNEASSVLDVDIACISDFGHLYKPTQNSLKVIRIGNESTSLSECRSSTDTLTSEETKKYEERVVKTLQLVDSYVEHNSVGRISYFRNQSVENGYSSRLYNPSVVDRKIRLKKLLLKYQNTTDKVEKVHVNDLKHRLGKKARLNTPLRELLAHFFKTCKRPILSKTGRDLVAEIQETYKKLPESVKTVIAYPVARQGNQTGQNANEQETRSAGSSAQVAESTSDETGSNQQEFRAQLEGLSLYFHEMQQEPMPTLRESMRHEWMRLKTFWSFPLNIGVSPFKLAKWGFYYTGHCGETKCFSCARIYKDWEDGDDPMSVHRRISPSCPFLLGTDIRNEPITRSSLPSFTPGGQLGGPLQSQDPSSTENSTGAMSVTQEQAISSVTTTPGSNFDNSNFAFVGTPTLVGNRILITASTNQEKNIDVTSTLQAGSNATQTSASTASTPNVVSTSTSETTTTGVPGTSPGTVTSTGFMATSFMSGNQTTTTPVTATAGSLASVVSSTSTTMSGTPVSAATRSSSGNVGSIHIADTTTASNLVSSTNQAAQTAPRTTSGPSTPSTSQPAATTSTRTGTTSSRSSSSNTTASAATHERYDPLGINFDRPRYPAYAVIANRSASFDQWPGYLRSPHEMAVAGFFYAGYGDYVRCFFCGGGLRNWEDEDDPWVEHTKWFPKCAFVKQNKGEQFIEKVLKRQEEIDKQRTHGTATITHEVDEATQGATAAPGTTEMTTSAVKAIKEMGYTDEPIQRALQIFHRRQEQASQELTAIALMHIILDDFDNSARVTTDAIPTASGGVDATSATGTLVTSPPSASSTEMALKITASGGEDMSETEIVEVKSSESPKSKDRKPKYAKGKYNRKKKKEQTSETMQPTEPGADDEINEEDSDMESLQAENVQLKSQLLCKVCAEQEVSMAFLPCGHLVCCAECGPAMRKCPICKGTVKGTVKTFFP